MRNSILIFTIVCIANFAFAQEWNIEYHGIPEDFEVSKKYKQIIGSNFSPLLKSLQTQLINEGYLAASIDSISQQDSLKLLDVYVHSGNQYQFLKLSYDQSHEEAVISSGYRVKLFDHKPLNPKQLSKLIEHVLTYYENNGYPFASVKLDSNSFDNNLLSSQLKIEKGPLIRIDSIYIKGEVKNSNKLIYTLIKVNPEDLFNQLLINQIDQRIQETPYLASIKETEYEFINNKCNLYLYVKNKPSSNVNGILGILQDDNNKITITGDARIKLTNSLFKGETIDINWKKPQNLTQNLMTSFNYPYILNTSFGIDLKFNLFKKDTSYLNLFSNIGIQFNINSNNRLTAFYQRNSSSLLSTKQYTSLTSLPEFADISNNAYGLEILSQNLDYKYNPRKGYSLLLSGSIGNKKIKPNSELNPVIYENIKLSSIQYNIFSNIYFHIPLRKRNTIKIGANSGILLNQNMFTNELFRIGGNTLLRGFNEQSIYASSYVITTLEYRFLIEKNSNIFAFIDGAWYEKTISKNFLTDTPLGFGAGISFSTKPGIFSVSYALGQQLGNPILFKTAKIHFGFVNFF